MKDSMQVLAIVVFFITLIAGWVNHIIICIAAGKYGLLIAGAIMFPIAMCHGLGSFMGAF